MLIRSLAWIRGRLKAAHLLSPAKKIFGYLLDSRRSWIPDRFAYRLRSLLEKATYADCEQIHDLPPMFHYWSNKYVLPRLKEHGIQSLEVFFLRYLQMTFSQSDTRCRRYVSIGAGNCDFEILLCKRLVDQGHQNFVIECLDFNKDALRRGAQAAREHGLSAFVIPVLADFNSWSPGKRYDCIIANQSLHHVVNLEGLFDTIALSLEHNGWFVTSDMIGRNCHARWPEAKEIIDEYWSSLTKQQRFNHISGRVEHQFLNPPRTLETLRESARRIF